MPNQLDRAAARARCEAASNGPWLAHLASGTDITLVDSNKRPICYMYHVKPALRAREMQTDADVSFICLSRTDLPAALDALDEAEAESALWQEMFAGLKEKYPEIFAEFWKEEAPCQE